MEHIADFLLRKTPEDALIQEIDSLVKATHGAICHGQPWPTEKISAALKRWGKAWCVTTLTMHFGLLARLLNSEGPHIPLLDIDQELIYVTTPYPHAAFLEADNYCRAALGFDEYGQYTPDARVQDTDLIMALAAIIVTAQHMLSATEKRQEPHLN